MIDSNYHGKFYQAKKSIAYVCLVRLDELEGRD